MYTQFFGYYLLSNEVVTRDDLISALNKKSASTLKLGIMAIDAGYMTASEVEKVHATQTTIDKRFGELAIELGFLNESQLDNLLSNQKNGFLLLCQSLVDSGVLSMAKFEESLKLFKKKYSIDDTEKFLNDIQLSSIVEKFVDGSKNRTEYHLKYIILLIKNLIRFIGDDFIILKHDNEITNDTVKISQNVIGDPHISTHMYGNKNVLIQFVSRFINEEMTEFSEYIQAGGCDFMNLHNGLFAVNMSMEDNIELSLSVPEIDFKPLINDDPSLVIKVLYPFGVVAFDMK